MSNMQSILNADKTISVPPRWVNGDDQRLWITAPLDISGVSIEGLNLRARVFKDRPDEDVLFQLEFEHDPKRRDKAIERIDWLPWHVHNNKGNGPSELRFVAQKCSHYHKFDLNWLPLEGRLKLDNLPIAEPISLEIPNFFGLLAFVGKSFRIINIDVIEQPGWQPALL